MSEATSAYFVAHVGNATPEVEARLLQWAAGCVEHHFERDVGTSRASLYFARAESRTVRQMQSLLRTLTARWKLPLGQLDPGWLRALTAEEFRRACGPQEPTSDARGSSSAALLAPAGEGRSDSKAVVEPSLASGGRGNTGELAQSCAAAYGVQPLVAGHGAFLERLPKGFDQRSQALLAAMCA